MGVASQVSVPLRGNGLWKPGGTGIAELLLNGFQSPCGVMVCGNNHLSKMKYIELIVSVPLRGNGLWKLE